MNRPVDHRSPIQPAKGPRKGTLAFLVGIPAAALLLTNVPLEESGRRVNATVAADGTAKLEHFAGPQYLDAYLDAVRVPTACDGITRGVALGQHYTPAQCDALLERELVEHAAGVMACTPALAADGRDYQRAAAVSLAYNIGVPAYCRSTAARRFNAGQWRAGCDAFLLWNKAGGRVLRGLAARRERERAICLKGLEA